MQAAAAIADGALSIEYDWISQITTPGLSLSLALAKKSKMSRKAVAVPDEVLMSKIFLIRDQKVMLDNDLAELYEVETKYLTRQVRRNIDRFPEDFMFVLSQDEYEVLRSQIGTLKRGQHKKYPPYVFTEPGVAQLSSVLNSERAIAVNIQIIRLFTKMRTLILSHKEILLKLEQLEKQVTKNSEDVKMIFNALKQLLTAPPAPRKRIGFKKSGEE